MIVLPNSVIKSGTIGGRLTLCPNLRKALIGGFPQSGAHIVRDVMPRWNYGRIFKLK